MHSPPQRKPLPTAEELARLPLDGGADYNRLVFEKSPYLLQHAGNPVDWYPWGEEAFARAKTEDKPIFLSIGYSTCHWCHVMEHESFEDDQVAALLNATFVCIKLDREERPDIDGIYMAVCQAMTGSGGWPLNVVMTAERKPFFAGTYFPKDERFGRPGLMELVPQIANAWKNRRAEIDASAERVEGFLKANSAATPGAELTADVLRTGFEQLVQRFDAQRGGFGEAPKFPTPHLLTFLLRHGRRAGDPRAAEMVEKTLVAMRQGGIYDQVGYGFHRYSTDAEWLAPHFEKMLYDQALLVIACVEAYQVTRNPLLAQTARETISYVLRDMTSPQGGFYSAEDADSEGLEGKFYVWTADEVRGVLGVEDGKLFASVYNIRPGGNFTNPHTPPGANIPHLTRPSAEHAAEWKIGQAELARRLEAARVKLFEARERRVHPHKDDKVLTDWNGLMIAALARAAQVLDEPRYAEAAQRAADFVLTKLRDERGRLLKRWRDGQAALPAHVDDYSFMIWGLLDLYETTFDVRNLEAALALNGELLAHFWDDAGGGLFFSADDGEKLLVRSKEIYDGAIPSGNSVAMLNLLRLGRITGDSAFEQKAAALGRAFSEQVSRAPSAHAQLLCGLDFAVGPSFEIVIAGRPDAADTRAMLSALRRPFVPNKVVLLRPDGTAGGPPITRIAAFTESQRSVGGAATAYVCRNYACEAPTTQIERMLALLGVER